MAFGSGTFVISSGEAIRTSGKYTFGLSNTSSAARNSGKKLLEAKLKTEKSLAPWTYITPKWRLDPLLKDRAGLMIEKQNAEAPKLTPINPKAK